MYGTSLVVQWLRLDTANAGAWVHTLAGEVLHAMWAIQKKEMYRQKYKCTGFLGGSVVKNLAAMQEMWVQSLCQEDPQEKETATHSSILAWRIHGQRSLVVTVHGVAKSRTRLSNSRRQHKGDILFIKNRIKLSSYKNLGMWKQKQTNKKTSKNNLQALKEWKQQPWTEILGKIIFTI